MQSVYSLAPADLAQEDSKWNGKNYKNYKNLQECKNQPQKAYKTRN